MIEPDKDFFTRLKGVDDLERYERLLEVYRLPDGSERFERVLRGDDPLLKLILLRFLQEIPERRAVRSLLTMLEDPHETVRAAAQQAYARNQDLRKTGYLRRYILSRNPDAARFAVKTLSEMRDQRILPLILALLPKAEAAQRREMIKALRFLSEPRAVPVLVEHSASRDESTRYQSLKTLTVLSFQGISVKAEVFLKAAQDPSPRIRALSLSALRNYSSRKIARFIQEKAFSKAGPIDDRCTALFSLASCPSRDWVAPLVRTICAEGSARLRQTAEHSLKRFPTVMLRRGLLDLLEDEEAAVRRQSAVLLAELFGDDENIRRRIFSLWAGVKDLQEKLEWLGVLRELGGEEVFSILYGVLKESLLLAYTAASLLNRLSVPDRDRRVLSLLRELLPKPVRQALLSGISRRGPDPATRRDFYDIFAAGLEDASANIRYMSLQGLSWYPLSDILGPVLGLLSRESDAHVARMASRLLAKSLGADPGPFVEALGNTPFSERLMDWMLAFLKDQSWASAAAGRALVLLGREPLSLPRSRPQDFYSLAIAWMERGLLSLDEVWPALEGVEEKERFLCLVRDAMEKGGGRFPPLPVEFLAKELRDKSAKSRGLLYALLGANRRPEGLSLLAVSLAREKDGELLRSGRERLKNLFWEMPS